MTCQTNGATTNCSGSPGQPIFNVPPVVDYGALQNSYARGQAQIQQMQAQTELANAQAAMLRQQQEALKQQEQIAAQQQVDAQRAAPSAHENSASVVAPNRQMPDELVRDPQQEKRAAERLLIPQDRLISAMAAATYKELKENAGLYEAVRGAAPKDSAMYRYAGEVLPLLYAELARRVP
jgi:hypothetical protein